MMTTDKNIASENHWSSIVINVVIIIIVCVYLIIIYFHQTLLYYNIWAIIKRHVLSNKEYYIAFGKYNQFIIVLSRY